MKGVKCMDSVPDGKNNFIRKNAGFAPKAVI